MTRSSASWPTPERLREVASTHRKFVKIAESAGILPASAPALDAIRVSAIACEFMADQLTQEKPHAPNA